MLSNSNGCQKGTDRRNRRKHQLIHIISVCVWLFDAFALFFHEIEQQGRISAIEKDLLTLEGENEQKVEI